MDIAAAQLALIFLPGIIWANLDAKYGSGLKPSQSVLLIRAFLFGIATYAILYVLYSFCGKEFGYDELGKTAVSIDIQSLIDEILFSIPLSFVLSILWLWSVRYRLVMKILHKVKATARYGDEDVWSFTFNSDQPHVEYVDIRDVENGYVFSGWVNAYSESEGVREILLKDAIVYDDKGVEISRAPHIYLSREKHKMWVEFPHESKEGAECQKNK